MESANAAVANAASTTEESLAVQGCAVAIGSVSVACMKTFFAFAGCIVLSIGCGKKDPPEDKSKVTAPSAEDKGVGAVPGADTRGGLAQPGGPSHPPAAKGSGGDDGPESGKDQLDNALAQLSKATEQLGALEKLAELKDLDKLKELEKLGALGELKDLAALGTEKLEKLKDIDKLGALKELDKLKNIDTAGALKNLESLGGIDQMVALGAGLEKLDAKVAQAVAAAVGLLMSSKIPIDVSKLLSNTGAVTKIIDTLQAAVKAAPAAADKAQKAAVQALRKLAERLP